jgi:hypothetical protein
MSGILTTGGKEARMSTTNSHPPLGSSDAFRRDDPDDVNEAMEDRHVVSDPTVQDRELATAPRDLQEKADMIVKREQGVTDFAHADETGTMIQPRSARDTAENRPSVDRDDAHGTIVEAAENVFRTADPDANDQYRRQ